MKTLHLFIIVILFSSIFGFGAAYAEQPLLNFYNTSDRVLAGKIISLSQVPTMTGDTTQYPNQTRYDVQVEAYYKDPQDFKLVTVYGYAKGIYYGQDPTYDVGDRVFLYLVKKNGFYQTQFPSFKLDNNCDARPMVPMSVLPFEGPEIAGPAGGSPFDFVDSDGSKRLTYVVGEKIHINFVATNYLPMVKYATLNFLIKTDNDTKLVFNNTKQIMLPACDGNVPVSWDFVPENRGSYSVYANMSSSINMGGTSLLFTEPRMADGFLVKNNPSGVKLDKSPYLLPPLQQFKSGITANDVKCNQGLQLVIKSEDGSPACVKPDSTTKLVQRGWTKEIVTNTSTESSTLNKTTTNELKIDLSNQTYEAGYPVYVNLKNMNQESTCKTPSISVRDTSDQSIVFGPTPTRNDTGYCADPSRITFYAGLEKNTLITKSTRYSILATLDNKIYQKEFTVIPSLYSNKNITADSTQIVPGYLTFTSCLPVSDVPNNGTLINYTGFDLYHRYLAGPDTGGIPEIDDYLLKPGHTGSFVMQIHQGQFSKDANLAGGLYFLSENLLNLDNSTVWNNRPLASEAHQGLVLSYTPSFAKVGPEGYATITASISALPNAPRGTYWLHLPPGICGGDLVLLTIGEQPLAQPPDYIGSDFASNFAQGVGNPTHSDVTFELINAGIHTFENCSLNYISENQTTTIKTFNVIPPGMEYKYHANLTSISKVSGFLECKKPSITKVYPDMGVNIIPY
jgi:hypothetical protein